MIPQDLEARYAELKRQRSASEITTEQFQQGVAELQTQGADGTWYSIDPNDGSWLMWKGTSWESSGAPGGVRPVEPFGQLAARILKLTIKNFFRRLPMALLLTFLFTGGLAFLNFYIIAIKNNGYQKPDPNDAALGLNMNPILGGLYGGIVVSITTALFFGLVRSVRRKGLSQGLKDLACVPLAIARYFSEAGDMALASLVSGAGVSCFLGCLLNGFASIAIAVGLGAMAFSAARQGVSTFICSAWEAMFGTVKGRRASAYAVEAGYLVMLGGSAGLIIRSYLPVYLALSVGLVLLVAAIVLAKGRPGATRPFLLAAAFGAAEVFLLQSGVLWAHDGGAYEFMRDNPGRTFAEYLVTREARLIMEMALTHGAATGTGAALLTVLWQSFLRSLGEGVTAPMGERQPVGRDPGGSTQPALIDPETGKPFIVQDGSFQGGRVGQIWCDGKWMDRTQVERLLAERRAEEENRRDRQRWYDEQSREWEQGVQIKREKDGYTYDAARDAWVPGPDHPDVLEAGRRQEADRLARFIDGHVKDPGRADFLQGVVDRILEHGGDMDRLREAIKDSTVGADQQRAMAQSDYNLGAAEAWQQSETFAEGVRGWSARSNRLIGRFVPGAGQVINMVQNAVAGAAEGYDQGGFRGAATSVAWQGLDTLVQQYTGIPGAGAAFRDAAESKVARDEDGNLVSPLDRMTNKLWHNVADQYDPTVYYDRLKKARGAGDVADILLDALDAGDDVKNLRRTISETGSGRGDGEGGASPRGSEDPSETPGPSKPRRAKSEDGTTGRGPAADAVGRAGGKPPATVEALGRLSDDYQAMQRAIASGDEAAADRYATRMMVKDHDRFKGLVADEVIDPKTAERAVKMHHEIITEGAREGMNRTRRSGVLLQDEIKVDSDGNTRVQKLVKDVWVAGRAMDPVDPSHPRVPSDTDLTPMVDRHVARLRGVDPDAVRDLAAGHTRDAINEAAKNRLGSDIGNYYDRTKVKSPEGTSEEYFSFDAHKQRGMAIDDTGTMTSTLGAEKRRPSLVDAEVDGSPTGRAMTRADEHKVITHNIKENPPTGNKYHDAETARELTKHLDRMAEKSGWRVDDVDKRGINPGFEKVLHAARSEKPTDIDNAVKDVYGGDYSKFYRDVHESSRQGVESALNEGGKIWDAQREGLRADKQTRGEQTLYDLKGISPELLRKDNVVQHATDPEYRASHGAGDGGSAGGEAWKFDREHGRSREKTEYLSRLGISEGGKLRTEVGRQLYDRLVKGENVSGGPGQPESDSKTAVERRGPVDPREIEIYERIQEHKQKDPVFGDLADKFRSAEYEGIARRREDIQPTINEEMKKEGKWGSPDSEAFQVESQRRVLVDARCNDIVKLKYQERALMERGMTPEQLDAYMKVNDKLMRGEPLEPLTPLKSSTDKSFLHRESPFGNWDPDR